MHQTKCVSARSFRTPQTILGDEEGQRRGRKQNKIVHAVVHVADLKSRGDGRYTYVGPLVETFSLPLSIQQTQSFIPSCSVFLVDRLPRRSFFPAKMLSSLIAVAGSATILLSLSDAAVLPSSPVSSLSYRGLATRDVAGYTFDGCYTEATNQRALTGNAYFDDL